MPLDAVHVVAAILTDAHGRVLVNKRPADKTLAGYWEFPGGKLERGESPVDGLRRELREELDIEVVEAHPFIQISHDYPDKKVFLDVWRVRNFMGSISAMEAQEIAWLTVSDLSNVQLLEADFPILKALRLPDKILITPPTFHASERQLAIMREAIADGANLIQLRVPGLGDEELLAVSEKTIQVCHSENATLIVNHSPEFAARCGAEGLHLNARRLMTLRSRPEGMQWVSASCHNLSEIHRANSLELDFITISPVKSTSSHPAAKLLGWEKFSELASSANMPVYALGGVDQSDLPTAWRFGACGIAAISSFWGEAG
ncbi:MAG: Nudix family hydrolase [Gammaproteobacteria bacterium]|nr:Nudix family hydrolase [Gammaproteobacteria bacterium]